MARDKDLASICYIWILFSQHLLKVVFFPMCYLLFWLLYPESDGYSCMGFFLCCVFCSICLCVYLYASTMLFSILCLCGIFLKFNLVMPQLLPFCSWLLWLFGVFFMSIWILGYFFLILQNVSFEFHWKMHWICRFLLEMWDFYYINSTDPQTWASSGLLVSSSISFWSAL